ncbi:MAG: RHS repeat-associated core domain-containing protein, partial [Gallionella sp.]|nr:RHS repeat-associated core domain-containing protein [Gallionella sp.]
ITGTVNGVTNPTFSYDANGNLLTGAGRSITWSSFNIPTQVVNQTPNGTKTAAFWYNPEHERIKELQADQSIVITLSPRYDTGLHFEKKYIAANGVLTGAVEYEHYLYAGGMMFGKFITVTATDGITLATTSIEYYSKDHLGSIVAITDGTGAVTQRLSYDVWGKRRYPNGTADPNGLLNNPDMYHGYTGHEHVDDVGLIHMNGRLYDPVMGRFVSADFLIPDAADLQYYNRYAYVGNNPLSLTDASGQCPWCIGALIGALVSGAQSNWDIGAMAKGAIIGGLTAGVGNSVGTAVSAWAGGGMTGGIVGGMVGGAAGSFVGTFVASGGNFDASWKSASSGAFSGALAGGMQANFGNEWNPQRVFAESVAGGVKSSLAGGRFSDGFKAAFAMSGFTYLNFSMRNEMKAQSMLNPENANGESAGFFGDGFKLAGARATYVWNKITNMFDKLACTSDAGGCQGKYSKLTADDAPNLAHIYYYSKGSLGDSLGESFSGPHDWLRNATGAYTALGNSAASGGMDTVMNYALIPMAAPLATAALVTTTPYGRDVISTARRR